ncbi:MAG: response regulator [Xenococcaceae cyanobacterium MO_188.B32]|nr:response regulator [Xenococcaceae cyanobacterium MO_188.B32]
MVQKRILVVDDDDGIREVIQICLEAIAGWEVIPAASGKEALTAAQNRKPDAILLDVMMPDMDGLKTFQQLQTRSQTELIPTIFLTAKSKISEQRKLQFIGVAGVIIKPFEPYNLVDQIKTILNW